MNCMTRVITLLFLLSRGHWSGENWLEFTKQQLDEWGVKYHKIEVGKNKR